MEGDFPGGSASPPQGGSPGNSCALKEGVGDQIVVASDLHTVEVLRLPGVLR